MTMKDCCEACEKLLALLKSAPPARSIEDERYQRWKISVDRALEQ